jgi:hypothetical protein
MTLAEYKEQIDGIQPRSMEVALDDLGTDGEKLRELVARAAGN